MKALLSVSDKSHLIEFAQALNQTYQVELVASGGTARALQQTGLPVTTIEDFTQSPEILDGRVKTLHPRVHGGILARDSESDIADLVKIGSSMIDLVVVNLYPFQKTVAQKFVTLDDAIENIDIGGVALIRAAAKNYSRVAVICDPEDYDNVLHDFAQYGKVSEELREVLALKAFAHTAAYDSAIRDYLMGIQPNEAKLLPFNLNKLQDLRYGENPHQSASLYCFDSTCDGPMGGKLLQGKELSYNNLLDLDSAWRAVNQFSEPTVVIVKHLSPCGIASSKEIGRAFKAAFVCDPVSAYGGVIAINRVLDVEVVDAMGDLFIECIVAPGFTDEARARLAKRKNCRLLALTHKLPETEYEYRSITGGVLRQSVDKGDPSSVTWKTVTKVTPTDAQRQALQFAWTCTQHVKSNAIVFAKEVESGVFATVGIGGGQPNRVDCVRIATTRAGEKAKGAVMASDAFFPFPDSLKEAVKAGIVAVAQPGGSVRDEDSIYAADEAGIAMVFTGARHFRH